MSDKTIREGVLEEASKLITGDRNQTYGSPTQNFQDTADVWNVILRDKLKNGAKILPGEVASMMIALKLVRQIAQPKRDNWTDIAGYAGCGHEVDVETGRINDPLEGPSQVSYDTSDYPRYYRMVPEDERYLTYRVDSPDSTPLIKYVLDGDDVWEPSGAFSSEKDILNYDIAEFHRVEVSE